MDSLPLHAAAIAAAQLNQKLASNQSPGILNIPTQDYITVDYEVPDRLVGLIIGKGGEHISQIQSETNCKVQFASDAGGNLNRCCTITGPQQSIERAKVMIQNLIEKGSNQEYSNSDQITQEILVPGSKVGLIIGKGGETIKNLQEYHKVKMVMIQETNLPDKDKPLRITGEINRCNLAREAINQLISEKDAYASNTYGNRPFEIAVPRSMVGIIIGKNGEMIKKIQMESCAKIQFVPDDNVSPERICTISGAHDQIQIAANMVNDLLANSANNANFNGGAGGGASSGAGNGTPNNNYNNQNEYSFSVPKEKCGLVIGKGGQTVQELCRLSNAHIELKRNQLLTSEQREFTIKGNQDQCFHAVQLISEKAGIQPPVKDQFLSGFAMGGFSNSQPSYTNSNYSYQNQMSNWPSNMNSAATGWQQQPVNSTNSDMTKDQNTWSYYQQLYQQQNQNTSQSPNAQQQIVNPQAAPVNPTTGQADYSQAWVEYFRQQGLHLQADIILSQMQGRSPGSVQPNNS